VFPPVAQSLFGFRNTLNATNDGGFHHPRLYADMAVGGTPNFDMPEFPKNTNTISRFVTTLIFIYSFRPW
jgi:hypothetical protein